ncbi:CWF19-like protein 2 homolog [Anticarsia gemmatalis]|uniref:CWF19-like protein 2 homolog n=1 Tax=Anticarsia gemmatalis TaxID=129554 RepID=UPI003F763088
MKEKRKKEKHKSHKSKSHKHKNKRRSPSTSSSGSSESDEWVEKDTKPSAAPLREDWMSMTGMLKTYTKDDIKPKREEKEKKNIDSYNPATSSRELNPYWKGGGSGLPQTSEDFRKSRPFVKPSDDDDDYYSRSKSSRSNASDMQSSRPSRPFVRPTDDNDDYYSRPKNSRSDASDSYSSRSSKPFVRPADDDDDYYSKSSSSRSRTSDRYDRHGDNKGRSYDRDSNRSSNWRKQSESSHRNETKMDVEESNEKPVAVEPSQQIVLPLENPKDSKYLSNEKMNKLAAKILKAEIMGDTKLVTELKTKLEAAREYRKQHPDAGEEEEDNSVMLIATSSSGNSRPLTSGERGDPRSKGNKRKAETHVSGERTKYFGDDDKYDLKQMFQEEKYGGNYNDEAELAKITSKHKNPNDDLEDIFMDEISKNRNAAKDSEIEKQRAISQHVKMTKSLEGCEYCVDSKNMLKHLMVSIGNKVYLAVPAKTSLVKDHCIITTIQHSTCVTSLDEDVWEEILNYRKALTQFYNSQGKDVVFFETAVKLHKYPHMIINCVPLPRDVGDMAAIYFKKAILECEAEWSMNKKVVDLKGKNIRRGVPKGLPYFWIDFGMDPGFAHVIEDQHLFPRSFAEEIIAGILDLDVGAWKNPRRERGDVQRKKVLEFIKEWKPFDPVKSK